MSGFSLIGVNLSGAEYDPSGTIEGTKYTYPTDAEIDYYASKGMTVIRLPFLFGTRRAGGRRTSQRHRTWLH
jgi:hypothetical protein